MKLRCLKCGWTVDEPEPSEVAAGSCPSCEGQLWSGQPAVSAILPDAVAMVFESGSKIARQGSPHYRQHDLTTGDQTSGPSQAFPLEMLTSPPVVVPDGTSTGVFDLPALPDLNFDLQAAQAPTDKVDAEGVEAESLSSPTEVIPPEEIEGEARAASPEVEEHDVRSEPALPLLPVMGKSEVAGRSRGVKAGLSNAPLFIDTRVPSFVPLAVAVVLSLTMIVGVLFFTTELAELWVAEKAAIELTPTQEALDAYAGAISDYGRGHLELAHDKVKQALEFDQTLAPAHTLLASILAKKGKASLALESYVEGRRLAGEAKDQSVERILRRAQELARLDAGISPEGEVDWKRVARSLEGPQGSVVPLSPSSAKP